MPTPPRRAARILPLLVLLALGLATLAPPVAAADFVVAVGGVRDACTGAHLGGAVLTFAPVGTPQSPPGPPNRVATNAGGRFSTALAPGDYRVTAALDGYGQPGTADGNPVGVVSVRTGIVDHSAFVLHPPGPC